MYEQGSKELLMVITHMACYIYIRFFHADVDWFNYVELVKVRRGARNKRPFRS